MSILFKTNFEVARLVNRLVNDIYANSNVLGLQKNQKVHLRYRITTENQFDKTSLPKTIYAHAVFGKITPGMSDLRFYCGRSQYIGPGSKDSKQGIRWIEKNVIPEIYPMHSTNFQTLIGETLSDIGGMDWSPTLWNTFDMEIVDF